MVPFYMFALCMVVVVAAKARCSFFGELCSQQTLNVSETHSIIKITLGEFLSHRVWWLYMLKGRSDSGARYNSVHFFRAGETTCGIELKTLSCVIYVVS